MPHPLCTTTLAPRFPLLGKRGVLGFCALATLALSGCAQFTAPLIPTPTPLPAANKRALESARYDSVSTALAKIDAQTVRSWVNRWSAPGGVAVTGRPPEVRIDADLLARRHPAWLLADSLQRGAISPSSPQIDRVLAVPAPSFSPLPAPEVLAPIRVLPPRSVGENFEATAARNRQSAALNRFFSSVEARDTLRNRDEVFLSRRALEDAIAAAQRSAVTELDLSQISPEVALELTNLRLQLLRSLSRTPAQRAATRQEIRAIEERYAEILREQIALQAAKQREATLDLPIRQRREGLARIERESQANTLQEAGERRVVAVETRSRLESDFARESADLHLTLPPARAVGDIKILPDNSSSQIFETTAALPASEWARANEALASKQPFDTQVAARLRAKARSEARQWASLVAAQLGSRWSNKPGNPDRTAAALAILFPTSSR